MSYYTRSSDERASHDKVNLGRILSRLEKTVYAGLDKKTWWEVRTLTENAKYARELLDSVIFEEGDAPGTSDAFSRYETTLNKITMNLMLAQPPVPTLPPTPVYTFPSPPTVTKIPISSPETIISDPLDHLLHINEPPQPDLIPGEPLATAAGVPSHPFSNALRQASHPVPPPELVPATENEKSEQLLGPPRQREEAVQQQHASETEKSGAIGSMSRLHDELTEQLAQMSTQLRKNAQHFSNSLEAEKPLLEQGANLLESNFSRLAGSSTRLGSVSSSGRSNTWLVLGGCAVVTLAWFWMYLIIRMT